MNEQLRTLDHTQRTAIDLAAQFGPKLPAALMILAAGYYVGRRIGRLADSGVNIAIQPWTPIGHFNDASSEITQVVLETFHSRGIRIPFPQREVRLLNPA